MICVCVWHNLCVVITSGQWLIKGNGSDIVSLDSESVSNVLLRKSSNLRVQGSAAVNDCFFYY